MYYYCYYYYYYHHFMALWILSGTTCKRKLYSRGLEVKYGI